MMALSYAFELEKTRQYIKETRADIEKLHRTLDALHLLEERLMKNQDDELRMMKANAR